MRCPRCNAQLTDNASFCGVCGTALSAPQGNVPEARPSFRPSGNNEATLMAGPWSDGQQAWEMQEAGSPMRSAQPSASPEGQPAGTPGALQWSQAQGPVDQSRSGVAPGMQANSLNQSEVALPPPTRKRRRAGRIWARLFLVLVLLLAVLAGAWFLGVRPYLHNLALTELDQSLSVPENQILLAMLAIPPGVTLPPALQVIHSTESSMNAYLGNHDTDQVQNLQMTITPTGMSLSFSIYGQNSVISAVPILSNGQLQVTDVQVQGVLWLIMSNDELTGALNSNLQNFSAQMTRKITKITLLEHEIDVQIA